MPGTSDIIFIVFLFAILAFAGLYLYYWLKERKALREVIRHIPEKKMTPPDGFQPSTGYLLKAQAYERLITFSERIGFSSLSNRLPAGQLTARQLAEVYTETIKTEFDFNISQQIYVSEKIWKAVCDMKDQQIFIIQQLVVALPEGANGRMLETAIDEFLRTAPNGTIQPMVSEAIRQEAKGQLTHM